MTNKEAIKILEVARAECEWNAPFDYQEAFEMAIKALKAQPKSCEYAVNALAVEEMLKNLLPERGMWEIKGDEAKTAICEVVRIALNGLWKLPFVKPDSKESSSTHKALDTISRQDAIDAIVNRTVTVDTNDQWLSGHARCELEIIDIINALPSAQPEQQWIPCSERLPQIGTQVLCCNRKGSVFTSAITYISNGIARFGQHYEVTAWMPLPEAYREGVK